MTFKRDFKRRVRERQARTGESYMTARAHVLAHRDPPGPAFEVIELVDLSAAAAGLGMRGRVRAFPEVVARVDPTTLLARLRDALILTAGDPATAPARAVLFTGGSPRLPPRVSHEMIDEGRRFMARVRAGLAGPSESGRLLAISVDGRTGVEIVVCLVWTTPMPNLPVVIPPSVILGLPEHLTFHVPGLVGAP